MKILLLALLILVVLVIAFELALGEYDRRARERVLKIVIKELPVGASLEDMRHFLEGHADQFALDERYHHVYAGILPQTNLDKWLFDRKVRIELKMSANQTFEKAEIEFAYTFL